VFDLLGKRLTDIDLSVEQGISEKTISLSSLPSGTYLIKVKDKKGNVVHKSKFIKN
jgi:hypothetical protein